MKALKPLTLATLVDDGKGGKKAAHRRETIAPGAEFDPADYGLDDREQQRLIDRGLAEAKKKPAGKGGKKSDD